MDNHHLLHINMNLHLIKDIDKNRMVLLNKDNLKNMEDNMDTIIINIKKYLLTLQLKKEITNKKQIV